MRLYLRMIGVIRQVTLSKTPEGKYSISMTYREAVKPAVPVTGEIRVGIDLGIKTFMRTLRWKEVQKSHLLL